MRAASQQLRLSVADAKQHQQQPQQGGGAAGAAADERARLLPAVGPTAGGDAHAGSSGRRALESSVPVAGSGGRAAPHQQQQQQPATGAAAVADGGRAARRDAAAAGSGSYVRVTLLLCLLLISGVAVQYLDATQLELLIQSLRGAPLASMVVFTLLFGAAVVLLVPGMLLSIGSGAAFGLASGALVAWLGTVLGQVGAFLLGRYLLRDVVAGFLEARLARFRAIDAGISEDGWKLVLLLRLSPVLPYNLMNYALGVTAIRLAPYTLASAAAAVPYVCLFAYLGSASTDLYRLLHDGARAYMSPQLLIGVACVMILSAVGLFFVCRHAVVDAHPDGCVDGDEDEDAGGGVAGAVALRATRLQAAAAGEGRSLLPTSVRDV